MDMLTVAWLLAVAIVAGFAGFHIMKPEKK